MTITRRTVIHTGAAALVAPALPIAAGCFVAPAAAQDKVWKHGLSLFGEPAYPADFKHFEYVNPQAPKGGTVRQIAFGTFDNFNPVVAGVKGSIAVGTDLVLRYADGAGARRGVDRVWPARRSSQLSGRLLVGDVPAARASEVA